MLRDYQQRAIDQLYSWFGDNPNGDPCLILPTGAGKSHIVAALCKNAVQSWPGTRILMLSHVKELISQNAEKMRQHWPNAPLGIYNSALNRREVDAITFGSIQSLHKKAIIIGKRDLVIVDECHKIDNKERGQYRELIKQLHDINPAMRVVGLTATPYRTGQGKLNEGDDALFCDLIEPVTVRELVERGFLAPLKSKLTTAIIDTSQVKKRGGEFIRGQLESASDAITKQAIAEIIARAGDRKHWLLFCSGVEHAKHCASELNAQGISANYLNGGMSDKERDAMLDDFSAGKFQALTNCDILTTGYDFPDIDLIAFLRPTMSPSLYVQMAGRGMRLKSHTDHCLVLDFAGNVERHGPIVDVQPPKKAGEGGGEAPAKACPVCAELVHTSCMLCQECGHVWEKKEKALTLSTADIMGIDPLDMRVTDWKWMCHVSRKTGKEMVKVKYYGGISDPVIDEYFCITHEGFTGTKARAQLQRIALSAHCQGEPNLSDMDDTALFMNTGKPPELIKYFKRGKYFELTERAWA